MACSNKAKTHPFYADPNKSLRGSTHAECRLLIHLKPEETEGSTVYIYRETSDGNPAMSRPCNFCYNELKKAGIKTIIYSISESPYYRKEKIV